MLGAVVLQMPRQQFTQIYSSFFPTISRMYVCLKMKIRFPTLLSKLFYRVLGGILKSGAFLSPAADNPLIAAAGYPSIQRGEERSVARSRHDNLPSSRAEISECNSGRQLLWFWIYTSRHAGSVDIVSTSPPSYDGVVALHQNSKAMEP